MPCQLRPENDTSGPLEDHSGRKTTRHVEGGPATDRLFYSVLSTQSLYFDSSPESMKSVAIPESAKYPG
jgi:hypothetical protein